jgi:hypothetical protein
MPRNNSRAFKDAVCRHTFRKARRYFDRKFKRLHAFLDTIEPLKRKPAPRRMRRSA